MNVLKLHLVVGLAAALLLALPLPAFADTVTLVTHLEATDAEPDATGVASFEEDDVHRVFRVEVNHISSTDTVFVLVNGELVDEIDLDAHGSGQLVLSSYHTDVPELSDGDDVQIVDADGTILLEGTLVEI
jgi:hypothetical protein